MYRIRLGSGEQTVFKSVEELALGLRSGTVDPNAEVYDQCSERWMPIEQHPDYALARTKDEQIIPVSDLGELDLTDDGLTSPVAPSIAVSGDVTGAAPARVASTDAPLGAAAPSLPIPHAGREGQVDPTVEAEEIPRPPRPRSTTAGPTFSWLTLGGGVLVAIIAVGFLGARSQRLRDAEASGAPSVVNADSVSIRTLADSAVATATAESVASPAEPAVAYADAYAGARSALDTALTSAGFKAMFAADRLASADSVRAARAVLERAGKIIAAYHDREGTIESTFRSGSQAGLGPSLRETFDAKELTRSLLACADSVYQLLLAQQGQYELSGSQVLFTEVSAARRYGTFASFLMGQVVAAQDGSDFAPAFTAMRVSRGLGALPPAFRR